MDGKVREVEGLGGLPRRGLAAPADKQLAEAPADEALVGVETGEALLRIEGQELLPEVGRLRARASEGGVDRTEDRG